MLEKVSTYIYDQKLIEQDDTILVAVSGGIDSMALLASLAKLKYNVGCGHINHRLRGSESNADAAFVRSYCLDNGIRYHHVEIPDDFFVSGNIHEKARNFRYQWLLNVADDHGYTKIATGHHMDDRIETFLMQAMRGTGLDGLESIPLINGIIIRPFLGIRRIEIEEFVLQNGILYREDSSNESDKYFRNKVRHQLMPIIDIIDTRQGKGLSRTLDNIGSSRLLLEGLIKKYKSEWIQIVKGEVIIDLQPIRMLDFGRELLYHLLSAYQFNYTQSTTIYDYYDDAAANFISSRYIAFLKNKQLYVSPISENDASELPIEVSFPSKVTIKDHTYTFEVIEAKANFQYFPDTVYLDADVVGESVTLRHWQNGDKMKPLGMSGDSQSLQDIFTNYKLTPTQKAYTIVMVANDQIASLLCWKTSDFFKVTNRTVNMLEIKEIIK